MEEQLCAAETRFWMYSYKVHPCLEPMPHDWATCPQQHHTEKAARRCPRTFRYSAVRCPQHNKKLSGGGRATCAKGDGCGCAHTVYELWLHPDRFRTQMCLHGDACTKPLCFFAHSAAELRGPQQLLLSGSPRSSAGAGDDARGGRDQGELDPAEELLQLHARAGGGRFSLAAALAEVQLRQRRLYGAAPPGRAATPAPAAPAPPRGAPQLGGSPPAVAWPGAAALAAAAAAKQGGLAEALHMQGGAGQSAAALHLFGQQLAAEVERRRLADTDNILRQIAASAPMSLSWPPHDPAAAAAAAAAAAWPWHAAQSLAPPPAVSSPPAVPCAATTALLAQYGLQAPLASHACPGAAAGAGVLAAAAVAERVRRDSLMWPLDLEPGPAASAAAAPHLPPPLDLASAAVGRSGSCTSAQSVCSAAGSVISSLATSGSGALRARSSSSDCSPSLGSSSTAACGGAFCSPVSCSVGGGGGGAAGDGGTPSPRGRLQQQLAQLQREQEQQAIKLHMLQLQCQGGFVAAPAPPALSSAGLMGGF